MGEKSSSQGVKKTTKGGENFSPKPPIEQPSDEPPQPRGCGDLIFPRLQSFEHQAIAGLVGGAAAEFRQQILDELAGAIQQNKIRNGVVPFVRALVQAAAEKRFVPSLGVAIAGRRANSTKHGLVPLPVNLDPAAQEKGRQILARVRGRLGRHE